MEKNPATLAEQLLDILGKPNWNDKLENGGYRYKYSLRPIDKMIKAKELLEQDYSSYIVNFNPNYVQSGGKLEGKTWLIIVFLVNPQIVPFKSHKHRVAA